MNCPNCHTYVGPNLSMSWCPECKTEVLPIQVKTPKKEKTKYRLKPRSSKQAKLVNAYHASTPMDGAPIDCCARCQAVNNLERHHPYARSGTHLGQACITLWIYLCHTCHHWVHHISPNSAFEQGWLQPKYRNQPHNADHPTPWKPTA